MKVRPIPANASVLDSGSYADHNMRSHECVTIWSCKTFPPSMKLPSCRFESLTAGILCRTWLPSWTWTTVLVCRTPAATSSHSRPPSYNHHHDRRDCHYDKSSAKESFCPERLDGRNSGALDPTSRALHRHCSPCAPTLWEPHRAQNLRESTECCQRYGIDVGVVSFSSWNSCPLYVPRRSASWHLRLLPTWQW